jgi:CO/xanthine dehydrogenase FAD-binding subunit
VRFLRPATWEDALAAAASAPDVVAVAGGTDVLVDLNFDRSRPEALLDLSRITALAEYGPDDGALRIGAGVTYTRIINELAGDVPGLAIAARTVGSPQIRNRGTVGGNLGSASPAGDAHPPLLAAGAEVEVASVTETRRLPIAEFFTGPGCNLLRPGELVAAVRVPPATGPQQFAKVGPRNAMVIAICSFALALHPDRRAVGTGIGSAGPTPLVASEAERFCEAVLAEYDLWESRGRLPASAVGRFGELVAAAARPIDDVRGSAAYRVHALAVLARRTLAWAWEDYRRMPAWT